MTPFEKDFIVDTVGKNDVQKALINSINHVSATPADQLVDSVIEKLLLYGFRILLAILFFFIGSLLIKWVKKLIKSSFSKRQTDKSLVSFVLSLVTVLIWANIIFVIIGLIGIETTSLAALMAASGLAIGMALSGAVQNFAGGILIIVFKPFKVGDYIEFGSYTGKVVDINIFSSKILTYNSQMVIFPNGELSNGTVKNIVYGNQYRRIDLTVGVEYGSDADKVIELLLQIVKDNGLFLSKVDGAPEDPYAGISNLSASSVDFVLKVWVYSDNYSIALSELNKIVYKTLPENGIFFPFPQISVHMDN